MPSHARVLSESLHRCDVAAMQTPLNPNSHLIVPVTIQSQKVTAFPTAMIDNGATSNFIGAKFVQENHLPVTPKAVPSLPTAIDGRPLPPVTHEVRSTMQMGNHTEKINLNVTNTGCHLVILGTTWLHKHNPTIGWKSRRVVFADPLCSDQCLDTTADVLGKKSGQPDHHAPLPVVDKPVVAPDHLIQEEITAILDGKLWVKWAHRNHCRMPRFIQIAGTSILAKIASEHIKKDEHLLEEIVPPELHDFLDVFDIKKMIKKLPEHRKGNIKINLVPGAALLKPGTTPHQRKRNG